MSRLQYVFDGSAENFDRLVLANSHQGPVLVNYWTPGAGPCFRLWQALEKLSEEYRGRFLLVNVNTEKQPGLVRENGITSVPTVKIYRQGRIVESIYGAESEHSLRKVIDRHVAPAQDTPVAAAIRHYQAGEVAVALGVLADASARDPLDIRLHTTALKLLLREQRYADIEAWVSVLPETLRAHPEISTLRVHAAMLRLAQEAPPVEELDRRLAESGADSAAIMSRAALAMVQDQYPEALALLLQALKQDRWYAEELPRKAMLVIFGLLGDDHPLTRQYQAAMRDVLH